MATTSGEPLPARGEVWWVRVDKLRPAVVVQTDAVREPRVRSFVVAPLTSRLHLEGLPGNVRLERRATGLPKPSVANLYDIQKVLSADFVERLGRLGPEQQQALDEGLRLVLDL
ncbi:MAG: type II toxin-antitoxin system PemK/MazF family toxin [Acidobacteria bacterium]|jgi:mRNA interferase MazF|nr:type II toxin-antitoxin system PemK/MazF family toxin [Acidobacteriota bacterium]